MARLDARLSAIEDLCVALTQRMDGLEATLKGTLTSEVRSVNADLRHNVSELGRLLVRDMGRLAKLLERHRESIVEELRPPPATVPEADPLSPSDPVIDTLPPRPEPARREGEPAEHDDQHTDQHTDDQHTGDQHTGEHTDGEPTGAGRRRRGRRGRRP